MVLAFDDFVVDPWNPFTTVLTLLAAALCAVALPAEARLVYALVVAASVAAQSHVACLLPAALLLAVAFWQARSRWRRLLALLLALWIGPVVDLVAGSHNLYHVARDLAGGDGGRFGLAPALRAMAAVFEPRQALSRGWVPIVELGYVDDHPSAAGWVCLAAAVAACAFVAWRGSGSTRRWALIVLIGIVLGVFSLSGAATPVFGHIVEWIDVLPLATVLVGWAWIADRWARHLRPVTLAALAVTSALAIVAGARATTPRRVTSVSADAIPAVARTILARFASAPVVLADDDHYHAGYVVAVANEIERRGGHVKIAGPWGEFGKFGDQRTPSAGNDCLAHLLVVTRRDGSPPPAPGEEVAAIALTDRGAGTMTVSVLSPSTCSR